MSSLFKVTALTGLLTILKMAMGFVIAKVVAVYTGPTGLAMLGQIQSMIAAVSGVINSPVSTGVVRYTAENSTHGFEVCRPWWAAALQWAAILLSITIPVGLIFSSQIAGWLFADHRFAWIVIISLAVLPIVAFGTLCTSIINGQQNYKLYITLTMFAVLLSGCLMIAMISFFGIQGALLAAALQGAIIAAVMIVGCLKQPWFKGIYLWGKTSKKARNGIARYMLMAITSAIAVPVSLIFVRKILISEVGWDAAGQWQAVWKISEVYLGVITIALGTYFLPKLASLKSVDEIVAEINRTALKILPILVILSCTVYLSRDLIITLLFTKDFDSSRELFGIQLIGDVFKIASWLYAYPMLSRGASKWFIGTEVFFSFTFVMLTYAFVCFVEEKAACYAYLLNYAMYLVFVIKYVRTFSR